MANICKRVFIASMMFASTGVMASDTVYNEMFANGVSIRDVVSYKSDGDEPKIIIQKYKVETPTIEELKKDIAAKPHIEYGEQLWTISVKDLPVTDEMCLEMDASTCGELKSIGSNTVCYKNCVVDISSLSYDKNKKILYLSAAPTNLGTAGGGYFIFSADVNTKKITYLKDIGNPLSASLSPSGKYLVTSGFNGMTILDVKTKAVIYASEKNDWTEGHLRLNYVGDIKWLSDSRFSYRDAVKHDKFQEGNDEMYEKIYDIPTQKILQSRLMDKNEYEHLMHK